MRTPAAGRRPLLASRPLPFAALARVKEVLPTRRARLVMPSAPRPPASTTTKPGALDDSWLLKGTRQKFLDAFLATAKIEHIMPKVGWGGCPGS